MGIVAGAALHLKRRPGGTGILQGNVLHRGSAYGGSPITHISISWSCRWIHQLLVRTRQGATVIKRDGVIVSQIDTQVAGKSTIGTRLIYHRQRPIGIQFGGNVHGDIRTIALGKRIDCSNRHGAIMAGKT